MPLTQISDPVRGQALDLAAAIVVIAALAVGILSVLIGKLAKWYEAICQAFSQNDDLIDQPIRSSRAPPLRTDADGRTGGRASDAVSANQQQPTRTALDRTRKAVIEQLLTDGWTITDMRREGILRGENAAVGLEVAEVKETMGMAPAAAYRTPIAGRPSHAVFQDPGLRYEQPPK